MTTDRYDYVIVGAGSAGCVLANRLSAGGGRRVLLLEAGAASHPLTPIPLSFSKLIDDPKANWRYRSEPETSMRERPIPVPRGKLLGGSSAINGLIFVRGQRLDYDTWAQLGNRGWSYDDVLPIFRDMETYHGDGHPSRGSAGPLQVSEATDRSALYDALFAAAREIGLPLNRDYNGDDQEGLCVAQTTIHRGRRMSAARCYLDPARRRANLHVRANAPAQRLIFDGRRCVGVRYALGGRPREARADAEVILSAGSINSPQLLELSGVGRPDILQAHGIAVTRALPGVGENLRDHVTPRLRWKIRPPRVTYNDRARGLGLVWQVLRYALKRDGFLNLPSGPVLAFLRTRAGLASPDIQLHVVPFLIGNIQKRELARESGITIACYQLRPESTGSVHIKSAAPQAPPAIRFNFLDAELDRRTIIDGTRLTRRLIAARAMDRMRGDEITPGAARQSDDEILDWIRETAETAYHPVGTCRMGPDGDRNAVVDERLRVRGVQGLRVADGSIMPTLVSGNTNGPCIMIGEKASRLILNAG